MSCTLILYTWVIIFRDLAHANQQMRQTYGIGIPHLAAADIKSLFSLTLGRYRLYRGKISSKIWQTILLMMMMYNTCICRNFDNGTPEKERSWRNGGPKSKCISELFCIYRCVLTTAKCKDIDHGLQDIIWIFHSSGLDDTCQTFGKTSPRISKSWLAIKMARTWTFDWLFQLFIPFMISIIRFHVAQLFMSCNWETSWNV